MLQRIGSHILVNIVVVVGRAVLVVVIDTVFFACGAATIDLNKIILSPNLDRNPHLVVNPKHVKASP